MQRDSPEATERRERFSAASALVADHFLCPCCLVAHLSQLLDALYTHQRQYAAAVPKLMDEYMHREGRRGWRQCELRHELTADIELPQKRLKCVSVARTQGFTAAPTSSTEVTAQARPRLNVHGEAERWTTAA